MMKRCLTVSVMKNCGSTEGRFFLSVDSEHHYEWLPPCPSALFIVRRYVVEEDGGSLQFQSISGNKCRSTERRTWFFYPECFSEIATKPSRCIKPREKV